MVYKLLKDFASRLGVKLHRIKRFMVDVPPPSVPPVTMQHLRISQVPCSPSCLLLLLFSESWTVIVTAIVAIVVGFIALAFCVVVIVRRTNTPSRAVALGSRTAQLGVIQNPPSHPIQQASANPYPSLPAPPYSLPSEPPPPYPGEEPAPPYSPPRQYRT